MGKRVNVEVSDEVHRRARIAGVTYGLTLQQLIQRGLELAAAEVEERGRGPYEQG